MFGRGTWAILGLAKDSIEAFRTSLEDRPTMAACSQTGRSRRHSAIQFRFIRHQSFRAPRRDEEYPISLEHQEALAQYAITEHEAGSDDTLPAEVLECNGYGFIEAHFRLHDTIPWEDGRTGTFTSGNRIDLAGVEDRAVLYRVEANIWSRVRSRPPHVEYVRRQKRG